MAMIISLARRVCIPAILAAAFAVASPAHAHDTPAEAANKKVVVDFYAALDGAEAAGATRERIKGIAETFIGTDYVQHSEGFANLPGEGTARDKLIRLFQSMPPMKLPPARRLAVMAEGDLVVMVTVRDMPTGGQGGVKPLTIFNMFRVKNGKLVEHWDSPLPMAPPPPGSETQPGNR
jgi:predicted SnoaL-like aldol condensation-catalyzing enzyme